jgi:ABC-type multidrug transport system ATPase subunit
MNAATPAVTAERLTRRYAGRWALRGVDLRFERGRAVMLCGANGAGKTTLIRMLGTAIRPTGGVLRLFGEVPGASVRSRVAMLSHADHHYDELSARENLALSAQLGPHPQGDVAAALAEVGLGGREDDLVRGFSQGMRKRLAFARLLWKRAELVLLDEPYAGLDPKGRVLVDSIIRRLRADGATVVLSTHQVERGASLCDDAVFLEAGRVSWAGRASEAPAIAGAGTRDASDGGPSSWD